MSATCALPEVYQSTPEITIIGYYWIGEVHAFGRFFKAGVDGQQWQMPPDCELQINRVIKAQPVLRRELQGRAAVRLTIEAQGQFLQECSVTLCEETEITLRAELVKEFP